MRVTLLLFIFSIALGMSATVDAQEATGSISGRFVVKGQLSFGGELGMAIVPTDTRQPIPTDVLRDSSYSIDEDGRFAAFNLADDYYYLIPMAFYVATGIQIPGTPLPADIRIPGPPPLLEYSPPLPATVALQVSYDVFVSPLPALLVTITNGQAVSGIEILATVPVQRLPTTGISRAGESNSNIVPVIASILGAAGMLAMARSVAIALRARRPQAGA